MEGFNFDDNTDFVDDRVPNLDHIKIESDNNEHVMHYPR